MSEHMYMHVGTHVHACTEMSAVCYVYVCMYRVTPQNISGFTTSLSRFNVGDDW